MSTGLLHVFAVEWRVGSGKCLVCARVVVIYSSPEGRKDYCIVQRIIQTAINSHSVGLN